MLTKSQTYQLRTYFSNQPVDAVYLFGSQTNDRANKLSDLDVGVLFKKNIDDSRRFDLELDYMYQVGKIAGFPDKVDVVDLERAPLALKFSAIIPRQDIMVGDKNRRTDFEFETLSRYFDYSYFIRQNTLSSLASIAGI
jgi:predicted nucleotidyltransferase